MIRGHHSFYHKRQSNQALAHLRRLRSPTLGATRSASSTSPVYSKPARIQALGLPEAIDVTIMLSPNACLEPPDFRGLDCPCVYSGVDSLAGGPTGFGLGRRRDDFDKLDDVIHRPNFVYHRFFPESHCVIHIVMLVYRVSCFIQALDLGAFTSSLTRNFASKSFTVFCKLLPEPNKSRRCIQQVL